MAELLFKRGQHANLPSTAVDGAFYLTTDTHRLYAGIGSELVSLNKYILTYASLEELKANWSNATEGDFAFVVLENVLAYYTGTTWTQINTNTDTKNKQFNLSGASNVLTLELEDDNGGKVPAELVFIGQQGVDVAVSKDGEITITGTTYDLATAFDSQTGIFEVSLTGGEEDTSFVLHADSNITFTAQGTNGISISSLNTTLDPDAKHELAADDEGNLSVTIIDTAGNKAEATAANAFYYTVSGVTVYNQNELPVYNKTEIDKKFHDLNGMTYKGTVASGDDLAGLTTVASGDMYMASTTFTYDGKTVQAGDLFIATTGAETDGVLNSVTWTYVPAGNDIHTDTQYYATANQANNSITVKNTTANDIMMTIDLDGDYDATDNPNGKIILESVVTSEGAGEDNVLTTTIKHAAPGAGSITADEGAGHADALAINVPTSFVIDSTGHVASYKEDTYTLATYKIESNTATAEDNVVTFESELKSSEGTSRGSVEFNIDASADDNLNVTASGNTITLKLEWGTF